MCLLKARVQQTETDVITPTAKKQIRLEHDRYILYILQAVQHDKPNDGHLAKHLFRPGQALLWFRLHG